MIEWDLNCCVVDWNKVAENIFGYSINEIRGKEFLGFILSENSKVNVKQVWENLRSEQGGTEHIIDNKTKDGREIVCKWYSSVLKNELGEVIGATAIVQDITAERQAYITLSKKEFEQRQILDCMLDAVITIDESGIIYSFNKAAETLFGYTAYEVMGQNVKLLMPSYITKQHHAYIDHYIQTGETTAIGVAREVEGLHKDGKSFPMRLSVAELPKGIDGKHYFIGSCVDLTELKQHEEQLRRVQKMDALDKLVGGIAHDFNKC